MGQQGRLLSLFEHSTLAVKRNHRPKLLTPNKLGKYAEISDGLVSLIFSIERQQFNLFSGACLDGYFLPPAMANH
jgi:hypothetical protein